MTPGNAVNGKRPSAKAIRRVLATAAPHEETRGLVRITVMCRQFVPVPSLLTSSAGSIACVGHRPTRGHNGRPPSAQANPSHPATGGLPAVSPAPLAPCPYLRPKPLYRWKRGRGEGGASALGSTPSLCQCLRMRPRGRHTPPFRPDIPRIHTAEISHTLNSEQKAASGKPASLQSELPQPRFVTRQQLRPGNNYARRP